MAPKTKMHAQIVFVVFLLLIKISNALTNSSTILEPVINSTLPNNSNESHGGGLLASTTEAPSQVIIDLYESTVENNDDGLASKTLETSTTTTTIQPPSTTATATPTAVKPTATSTLEVHTTTTATPTTTTTKAPETTSNPQQMLIPPASVNASIAQMPNAKANTHKQGQIIIR